MRRWQRPLHGTASIPLTSIICPSLAICYAVGYESNELWARRGNAQDPPGAVIVTTANGGRLWRVHASGDNLLSGIACPSVQDCFAIGYVGGPGAHAVILATHDGGAHWKGERHPQARTMYDLIGIACPGPTLCYAVGLNGYILIRR